MGDVKIGGYYPKFEMSGINEYFSILYHIFFSI